MPPRIVELLCAPGVRPRGGRARACSGMVKARPNRPGRLRRPVHRELPSTRRQNGGGGWRKVGGEGRGRFETAQFLEGRFSRADRGQRTGKGCCWLLGSKTRRPSLTRGKGLGCGVWCSAAAPPPRRAIDSSMSVILRTWMRFLRTFTCHAQRAPLDQPEVARGGGGAPGVRARNFFAPRGGRCSEGTVAGGTH